VNDVIQHLVVKKDAMERASAKSYAVSLDVAEVLVTKYKVPFRTAHQVVGALVNLSVKNKDEIPFNSLTTSDIRVALSKVKANIAPDKLIKAIREMDSMKSIRIRNVEGSPNPKQQTRIIRKRKLQLQKYSKEIQKKKERIDIVKQNIANTIKEIVTS
jgi:argininosuccinate lyase